MITFGHYLDKRLFGVEALDHVCLCRTFALQFIGDVCPTLVALIVAVRDGVKSVLVVNSIEYGFFFGRFQTPYELRCSNVYGTIAKEKERWVRLPTPGRGAELGRWSKQMMSRQELRPSRVHP